MNKKIKIPKFSKIIVFVFWNQGTHFMGLLWIQTCYNLDYKHQDYGPPLNLNMYDQIMISLESCSIYYDKVR